MTVSHATPDPVHTFSPSPNARSVIVAIATDPRLDPQSIQVLVLLGGLAVRDSWVEFTNTELHELLGIPGVSRVLERAVVKLKRAGYLKPAESYCPRRRRLISGWRITLDLTQFRTLQNPELVAETLGFPGLAACSDRAWSPPRARRRSERSKRGGEERAAKTPAPIPADSGRPTAPPPPLSASPDASGGLAPAEQARTDRSQLIQAVRASQGGVQYPQESQAEHDLAEGILEQRMPTVERGAHLAELLELVAFAGTLLYWRRRLTIKVLASELSSVTAELRDKLREAIGPVVATQDPAAVAAAAAVREEREKRRARYDEFQARALELATAEDFGCVRTRRKRAAQILEELLSADRAAQVAP